MLFSFSMVQKSSVSIRLSVAFQTTPIDVLVDSSGSSAELPRA